MSSTNFRVIRKELASQKRAVTKKTDPVIEQRFRARKEEFLRQFDNHPVTLEIKRGPGTRQSMLEEGNIFSALGFEEGESPTVPVRSFLKDSIYMEKATGLEAKEGGLFARNRVFIPTLDEIDEVAADTSTLGRWSDRGWVSLIQNGIPGFPRFLSILHGDRDRKKRSSIAGSASGTAIQVKTKDIRGGSNSPISYINELLASFKALLNGKKR